MWQKQRTLREYNVGGDTTVENEMLVGYDRW